MAALLVVPIIGAVSFAVELGVAHGTGLENQYATDVAALAGALDLTAGGDDTRVRSVAIASMVAAGYEASSVTVSIIQSPNNSANQAVRVDTTTSQQYFLAQVLNAPASQTINTTAIVDVAGGQANVNSCVIALNGDNVTNAVVATGNGNIDAAGCSITANGGVDISGGSDVTVAGVAAGGDINVQNGSNLESPAQITNAPPVSDPFIGNTALDSQLAMIGSTLPPAPPQIPPGFPSASDFDPPGPFSGNNTYTFQGTQVNRVGGVWLVPPGDYHIDRYRATGFNDKVLFQDTPGNPSTVVFRNDISMSFGADLTFENDKTVISFGSFQHNGGGDLVFGDGDITFKSLRVTGTSTLAIGDGDLNVTSDGLFIGGSSEMTIGNGLKRVRGDIAIGGQASLSFGSGDIHIIGDFDPNGSATLNIDGPSNVFITGDYVGGDANTNNFNDVTFFVDGEIRFGPSSRVQSIGTQYFSSGRIDIASSNGSRFAADSFTGTSNVDEILFATTSDEQSLIDRGGDIVVEGIIYIPNGDFLFTGGTEINSGSECFLLLANTVTLSNGSDLNSQCTFFPPEFSGTAGPLVLALVQ